MKLPETGYLRLTQILPQREVTPEEAKRNREEAAALRATALKKGIKPKCYCRPCRPRLATPGLIPVSCATWLRGVKSGRFPKPVKLGSRIAVWRVEDIRKLIANGTA